MRVPVLTKTLNSQNRPLDGLVYSLFPLLVMTAGCGQDTTGDTVQREQDRQREAAAVIEKDFAQVKGTYQGPSPSGASDITLQVQVSHVTQDGTLVPQPTLVGFLVYRPRVLVGNSNSRIKVAYPLNSGAFDRSTGNLSFTVQQNGNPTRILCTASGDSLDCTWYLTYHSHFILKRTDQNTVPEVKDAFGGIYEGETDKYFVYAEFAAALSNQNGSLSVPTLSIVGKFILTRKQSSSDMQGKLVPTTYSFNDGSYDVGSDIIALSIPTADNAPNMIVNCKVNTNSELHCDWFSRGPGKGFDLQKKNTNLPNK